MIAASLAALALFACQGHAAPPRQSTILKGGDEAVTKPRSDFKFTHVLASTSETYRSSPAQGRPADGRLSAGTRVRLVSDSGSYAKIELDNGMEVYVAKSRLRASTPELEDEIAKLVAGNNRFALDLYGKLRSRDGNLFFSPYSISTALAMTYAGAGGTTAEQIRQTLALEGDVRQVADAYQALSQMLTSEAASGIQLSVANRLWGQQGYGFLPDFLRLTREDFGAPLAELDFAQTDQARAAINDWVAAATQGKIGELIPPGALDAMTRLVLTNAIYFKGGWTEPFEKKHTREAPFFAAPDRQVKTPMMHRQDRFGYRQQDGLQTLELPYGNDELSMLVLLPEKQDGLAELEAALTADKLAEWTTRLGRPEVSVFLPKFKVEAEFNLNETLSALGMPAAFSNAADFSGMSSHEGLKIAAVLHKAYVDVNEEGTEAAAATGVIMMPTAMPQPQRIPVFRADHPFLFLIRDNRTGEILFIGRVTEPKA